MQCHTRCVIELNESNQTKELMIRIQEKAKLNESTAFEELMETVIGEIQKEFFACLEKEIDKTSNFYT